MSRRLVDGAVMAQGRRRPVVSALLPPSAAAARDADLDGALLLLAEQLLRAAKPQDVARSLLETAVTTYGFPRGAVVALSERRVSALASHGVAEVPTGAGTSAVVDRAHDQRTAQVLSDLSPDSEPWLAAVLPPGTDLLVVPLSAEDRALGALVLQIPVTLRSRRGRRLLEEVERGAAFAALAWVRVQRLAQLQRLAATDDLTMIANRRSFTATLDRELARSVRRGEPVSLVLLDLDEFKQVNDVFGHPAGDEALRNVAAALTIACRDFDTPARYGGEEFVVILPDCDTERCFAIAERLRAAVRAAPAVRPLTASAGAATFPTHARDAEQLVLAADTALLQAKRNGRDRTVLADAAPEPTESSAPARGGRADRSDEG